MVPIIENYAIVFGALLKISETIDTQGFLQVELSLEECENVGEYANLAKADLGKIISINVKTEWIPKLKIGEKIRMKVKKVTSKLYVAMSID